MKREVLTREQTATYIKCSRSKLHQMELLQRFPKGAYFNIGRRRFYFEDKLDEWLAQGGEIGAIAAQCKGTV